MMREQEQSVESGQDLREVYEPPMLHEVGDYSELTTGCGFNFFELVAQHSNCSNW